SVALPPRSPDRRCSQKHFGEYELFPGLIGLSPLPTDHPETFQRLSVRSSTPSYRGFNLSMGRSPGFASAPAVYTALFGLAFAPGTALNATPLPARSNS